MGKSSLFRRENPPLVQDWQSAEPSLPNKRLYLTLCVLSSHPFWGKEYAHAAMAAVFSSGIVHPFFNVFFCQEKVVAGFELLALCDKRSWRETQGKDCLSR